MPTTPRLTPRTAFALSAALVWLPCTSPAQQAPPAPSASTSDPLPPAQFRPWPEYQVIMWTGDSAYKQPDRLPLFWQRMKEMGVTGTMVHGDGDLRRVLDSGLSYYVENMVNKGLCLKFNSKVKDWNQMVTAWKTPRDEAGLVRDYSFDDPEWRNWTRQQMKRLVEKNAPHAPLLYDLRDELSVTHSANPFDYDFSPTALAGFRRWLEKSYGTLEALNTQWETKFKTWDEVKPFTTDQIKHRMATGEAIPRGKPDWQALQQLKFQPREPLTPTTRWNLSPWADHRTYMDVSLAETLGDLRRVGRELDPKTPVGIEGTQMPAAFGGYDLWRLSQSLDWVEPYDITASRAIFGSFMPGATFLTTVGEPDAADVRRRLWHLLLEGDRGCIIWWSEDSIDWKSDDYRLTPRAQGLIPVLKEMRSPLARLFLRAKRETDPIAIHYSQPSVQAAWLLESTVDGSTWLRRFSSYEAAHNVHARYRVGWLRALENAGYTPTFLSTQQIEEGALSRFRVVVLPQSYALTDREAAEFGKLLTPGATPTRTLLADGFAGLFDGRARLRSAPALQTLLKERWSAPAAPEQPVAVSTAATPNAKQLAQSLSVLSAPVPAAWVRQSLGDLAPAVEVPAEAGVRVVRFQLGTARIFAFEQNHLYEMGEDLRDKSTGRRDPVTLTANLRQKGHLYDLRTGQSLGANSTVNLTVEPGFPALIAWTPEPLPSGDPVAALHAQLDGQR